MLLLLTTDAPGKLLDTIRSRMIEVRFSPIPKHKRVLSEEEREVREAAVAWFFGVVQGGNVDDGDWALRESLEEGLETIKTLTRDWLVSRIAGKEVAPLASDEARSVAKLPAVEIHDLVRALTAIEEAERVARTNVTPHLVAESVRMALAACSR